jgi:Holliday junction resolvase RusA-like endonuclease
MKYILTIPPSINRTYGITRSGKIPMYKKKAVRSWEYTAGWEIKAQRTGKKEMILDKVFMTVVFYYSRDRDIDNGLKVLLDLFQKQRIYKNDKQIVALEVFKLQDKKQPRVEVQIQKRKEVEK